MGDGTTKGKKREGEAHRRELVTILRESSSREYYSRGPLLGTIVAPTQMSKGEASGHMADPWPNLPSSIVHVERARAYLTVLLYTFNHRSRTLRYGGPVVGLCSKEHFLFD